MICSNYLTYENQIIGGDNIEIQIDETKFGKVKYHRDHRVDGVWVFGGIEITDEKKFFLIPVVDRTVNTLINLIIEHARPGSIIITGYCRVYNTLGLHRFVHLTVNYSIHFKDQ
ncbi:hypothetical protein SteCoe_37644 [Stentor coeruleus]|uniref:ISXO2-like transposase domain-containing protein n=1 Tax=Stentor coeruleus TaxID=5963 RepID=A0A1R2AMM8_9CILI|nr:hypothetical protein SteCoe_37644 [Stentor coeruleus]